MPTSQSTAKKLHRTPSACPPRGLHPPRQSCGRSDTWITRSRLCGTDSATYSSCASGNVLVAAGQAQSCSCDTVRLRPASQGMARGDKPIRDRLVEKRAMLSHGQLGHSQPVEVQIGELRSRMANGATSLAIEEQRSTLLFGRDRSEISGNVPIPCPANRSLAYATSAATCACASWLV